VAQQFWRRSLLIADINAIAAVEDRPRTTSTDTGVNVWERGLAQHTGNADIITSTFRGSTLLNDALGSGLRAVVIEGDSNAREQILSLLKQMGFSVSLAEKDSLLDAISADGHPDIAVLDAELLNGRGPRLVEQIHSSFENCQIIIQTANPSLESAVDALRLRVADYMPKPAEANRQDVESRLRTVIGRLRQDQARQKTLDGLRERYRTLEDLSIRDPLTRTFNHPFLQELLEKEVLRNQEQGQNFSLLLIDIDNFKAINNAVGHNVGDRLLTRFSALLKAECDTFSESYRRVAITVARFGHDVFAILLPNTEKPAAAQLGESIRRAVEKSIERSDNDPGFTVSVGVAQFPSDGSSRAAVVEATEAALFAAKGSGRNRLMTYSASLGRESARQKQESEFEKLIALDRSMEHDSFTHVYQPIVRTRTGEIFAYESLCRPTDPTFSGPAELIATAERAGRVSELGKILRRGSVDPLGRLPEPCLLFLNIHPVELQNQALFGDEESVCSLAQRTVLEITESAAIDDHHSFRRRIQYLRTLGFRIALDDLGAGYAGLNALATLEPDFVKLDMGLIRGVMSDSRSARLIKHIFEFTAGESMLTIAEGIETQAERAVVEELGCPLMQGFLFGTPQPPFSGH
jgi:diguanylate cyclase (GGDEF)-like protein